ncbi:hypothetical protein N7475_006623 [Penicillium sp. IBT 31633x]|nr:hypothetical protein N7475_006623 [Penicillium sp. IBT 31633x]
MRVNLVFGTLLCALCAVYASPSQSSVDSPEINELDKRAEWSWCDTAKTTRTAEATVVPAVENAELISILTVAGSGEILSRAIKAAVEVILRLGILITVLESHIELIDHWLSRRAYTNALVWVFPL